jgi:hypothetical protein
LDSPIRVHLVCGGRFHDFDYARLELLALLAHDERIRTTVSGDYRDLDALNGADCLISYTCDLRPSDSEQAALADWVSAGGRWFALHGTNSALDLTADGVVAPRVITKLAETLGSQFVAHPPIAPYEVQVTRPDHPLVFGLEAFETEDELYLSEMHGEIEVLLHTEFAGEAKGFTESSWFESRQHAVMYLHPVGAGEVLYLTLGHCRGHYDMMPVMDYWPTVDRGSWESETYRTLLRRGVRWMTGSEEIG